MTEVPEIVIAMQLTEYTYQFYLNLPAETHFAYEAMAGNYIVMREGKKAWGWADEESFELNFLPIESPMPTMFTRYVRK